MTPIHELLSRFRWDPAYADGHYEIGYWDRVCRKVIRVPLSEIGSSSDDHFAFHIIDDEGVVRQVPWHRVIEVYRDSQCIWQRNPPHPAWAASRKGSS